MKKFAAFGAATYFNRKQSSSIFVALIFRLVGFVTLLSIVTTLPTWAAFIVWVWLARTGLIIILTPATLNMVDEINTRLSLLPEGWTKVLKSTVFITDNERLQNNIRSRRP